MTDLGNALATAALTGTSLSIESTFNPGSPFTIDLTPSDGSGGDTGPNWLVALIKPKVSIETGGGELASVAPGGDPAQGPPWGIIIVGLTLALAAGITAAILVK